MNLYKKYALKDDFFWSHFWLLVLYFHSSLSSYLVLFSWVMQADVWEIILEVVGFWQALDQDLAQDQPM